VIRLALLGQPVVHSRSPAMMHAALAAMGLEGVYVPFEVAPEGLGDAVRGLAALRFDGANVTVPHKVAVMEHLAAVDDDARLAGAVNTLVRAGEGFVGYNTDIEGLREALAHHGASARGERAVVLGGGGAARAAAVALVRDGAVRVDVVARRSQAAMALADVVERAGASAGAHRLGDPSVAEALGAARIVVQATSCGMAGGPDSGALLAGAPLAACARGTAAVDLVYAPPVTPWMRAAEAAGLRVLEGAGAQMLAGQGAAALARWTGREAPVAVMRAALWL
jgi:shikimate dehydrogenase